jgi:hypothetical protein
MASAMEAVPIGGFIDRESTPFGIGGTFHEGYLSALNGQSNFIAHFAPWFEHPEFTLLPDSQETLPKDRGVLSLTVEEAGLAGKHGLTEGQIRWRRWKQEQRGRFFWQEYPEDDVSCWLSSEFSVYGQQMDILKQMLNQCSEPNGLFSDSVDIKVWKRPDPSKRYYVAADPAGGNPDDGDPSAASFLSQDGEEVATIHGYIPPTQFTRMVCDLAIQYNRAMVCFERTGGIGIHCLEVANETLGYPNLYRQRGLDVSPMNEGTLGWTTSETSKIRMLTAFREAIGRGDWRSANKETIREVMEYRKDEKTGKYGAPRGRHDDRHDAAAMAWQVLLSAPTQIYLPATRQVVSYPVGL